MKRKKKNRRGEGKKKSKCSSELLREKHYAFSLWSVCTWKNRSKSRACVFWVLLLLCHQPCILQKHLPAEWAPSSSPHLVHMGTATSGMWYLLFIFPHDLISHTLIQSLLALTGAFPVTSAGAGSGAPVGEEALQWRACSTHTGSSLTGCTRVSRGTFKLHFNSHLLIKAVNYRTGANKSSLGYDGT